MNYGLTTVNISPKNPDDLMGALYYKALPLLGINPCIAREWRLISEKFQGLGLLNFVADCLTAKLFYLQRSKWSHNSLLCAWVHIWLSAGLSKL